jgi:hypothetical protein
MRAAQSSYSSRNLLCAGLRPRPMQRGTPKANGLVKAGERKQDTGLWFTQEVPRE